MLGHFNQNYEFEEQKAKTIILDRNISAGTHFNNLLVESQLDDEIGEDKDFVGEDYETEEASDSEDANMNCSRLIS